MDRPGIENERGSACPEMGCVCVMVGTRSTWLTEKSGRAGALN
jgi:hypothetical protein